jgi:4-hydroxy-3-polyprenylbenzoate decarboxylase
MVFNDLREYIEACKNVGEWKTIEGADWNLEIGALTEAAAELIPQPPMLLFDPVKGYPLGYRVVSLLFAAYKRGAIALDLPPDKNKLELVRLAARKIKSARPIPPREVEVDEAPVMENRMKGEQVDLFHFPSLHFHEHDGGRYIGTGDVLINRDLDSNFINMGTYRMQVHEKNLLGLWMSPGQHGRQICSRYWEQGKSCPVVATFGGDPLTFMASHTKLAWGISELDYVGGLRGKPLEVIKGPITGLPIPAHAEVAIEGEVPPPNVEAREEGPYGEWPGYYSGGTIGTGEAQPVIRVKAIYYRNDPIIINSAPMWPGAPAHDLNLSAGVLWDQLEGAGIQDIAGVYGFTPYLFVVAIKQRYAGHAKQAGHAALACAAAARNGRYLVVVDEDIDPTNLKEVLWAMMTRVDPATTIELIDKCWSTPLDPRIPPEKRAVKDHTNSRAIFYAVRPFEWKEKFPKVSRTSRELREQVLHKYSEILPFPPR